MGPEIHSDERVAEFTAGEAEVLARSQSEALLQLLLLSQQDVEAGRVRPLEDAVARLGTKLIP